MTAGLFDYLLALGDDALVTAQRLGEWYASSPAMEEDIALANIALDQLGAARLLLSYAADVPDTALPTRPGGPLPVTERPLDEDALAYRRDDRQFRNALLVELPNGDFAHAIVRLTLLSAYQVALYDRLAAGSDARLAGIAAKARKEVAYHLDHAGTWLLRLGDGTAESHRRAQAALDELWPYATELFTPLLGGPVDPATLREPWLATVAPLLAGATLTPPADAPAPAGGRDGLHTEYLSYLLAEMQSLHRAHPGARW
ncbi:putative phenylacetic acid degradation protein PaaC/phenylacetate-CoA oxygenase, PaaI subunit [Pilimelia anulata]|uniref:Putative phenylacetic acid degradation protein PaaC/phenylacetate-CoA oxygenase, PaaI subunit n=1 Tax=Pilimelia anulata TaxID=53371 RepID=A0A8J3FB77_9ACTN|nr:1,2-phenylacetyl-CoA epoxidase subunit PaaC [Pilimelia anulata]GGJ95355.1 putative phenylacetic acid degradation protein PaaC/phenylacetate-CoA oxygenase, PaaI subunit [Pilimelia anulata]